MTSDKYDAIAERNRAQTLGQWSAEHLESLRQAAQTAERHESEMRTKLGETAKRYAHGDQTQIELAEAAECYSVVKRACFVAQERYSEAIRTN